MIKSLLGAHHILIIEQILSTFRFYIDTSYQTSLYKDSHRIRIDYLAHPPLCLHTPYFFHRKKSNFFFSYRAWKTLENEPMITCLGFVFFGRRRFKERGQYFRKFLGKIDEIQKSSIFTKPTWAHFKAFLMSFSIKQSNSSWVYFFFNFTSIFTAYLGC